MRERSDVIRERSDVIKSINSILIELDMNNKAHKYIYDIITQSINTAHSMTESIIELNNKVDILIDRIEELESKIPEKEET